MSTVSRSLRANGRSTSASITPEPARVDRVEVAPAAPRHSGLVATWTLSRAAGVAAARARGIVIAERGCELQLRAILGDEQRGGPGHADPAAAASTVRLELVDPDAPAFAPITLATGLASCSIGQAGELAGLVVRDAQGTLLDLTFGLDLAEHAGGPTQPQSHARTLIFARTDIFARLGIEGGRYELA